MKYLFHFLLLFILLGCSNTHKESHTTKLQNMYQQSEMAALMLEMYELNSQNKILILEGKQPKKFPDKFFKIHTAKLTDSSDRNASFEVFTKIHLNTYQQLLSAPKDSLIQKHNNTIISCIACHKTTCIGPIPRIKKLLIK